MDYVIGISCLMGVMFRDVSCGMKSMCLIHFGMKLLLISVLNIVITS